MARLLLLPLLGALLACSALAQQTLPEFSTINLCVPFTVAVSPGSGYALQVQADQEVANSIQGSVQGGALSLETKGAGFMSGSPIQVTILLPADKLAQVNQFGQADTFITSGFTPDQFTLSTGFGSGRVYVDGMRANSANVQAGGNGPIVLSGSFGAVDVATVNGISTVFLDGVRDRVSLDLSGISNVYVTPASGTAQIGGRASGIANVYYSQGQCSVQSGFPFSGPCTQSPALTAPTIPAPVWTSGLTAIGGLNCAIGQALAFPSISFPSFPVQAPLVFPSTATQGGSTNLNAPNPFTFAAQTPGGAQFQAGSATPTSGNAQSAAQGTNSASATSVASPGSSFTQTSNDGVTNTRGTSAPPAPPTPPPKAQPPPPPKAPSTTSGGRATVAALLAPAPAPEAEAGTTNLNAPNPFTFAAQTPGGAQFQAGAATPTSGNAQSAAQGTNSASATSVAGPGTSFTQTSNDGTTNTNRATAG